jgi:chemotaxis protein methyltransferase CheR
VAFTFFFRDLQTLELLVEHFIPYVSGRNKVTVWDAGCAMGPEPYTLAILLAERMGPFAFKNLRILASDVDPTGQFGPIVSDAEYPRDELVRIPPVFFERYFGPGSAPDRLRLRDDVRSRVRFVRHDLLSLSPVEEGVSAIVCKNVLLHLQPSDRVAVIRMFHRALAPSGLMAFEHTQELPEEAAALFHQVATDARVFRKVDA